MKGKVQFNFREHPHLDYGYADQPQQLRTDRAERALIHADADKSELLINNRFAYVSVSRAQHDAHLHE